MSANQSAIINGIVTDANDKVLKQQQQQQQQQVTVRSASNASTATIKPICSRSILEGNRLQTAPVKIGDLNDTASCSILTNSCRALLMKRPTSTNAAAGPPSSAANATIPFRNIHKLGTLPSYMKNASCCNSTINSSRSLGVVKRPTSANTVNVTTSIPFRNIHKLGTVPNYLKKLQQKKSETKENDDDDGGRMTSVGRTATRKSSTKVSNINSNCNINNIDRKHQNGTQENQIENIIDNLRNVCENRDKFYRKLMDAISELFESITTEKITSEVMEAEESTKENDPIFGSIGEKLNKLIGENEENYSTMKIQEQNDMSCIFEKLKGLATANCRSKESMVVDPLTLMKQKTVEIKMKIQSSEQRLKELIQKNGESENLKRTLTFEIDELKRKKIQLEHKNKMYEININKISSYLNNNNNSDSGVQGDVGGNADGHNQLVKNLITVAELQKAKNNLETQMNHRKNLECQIETKNDIILEKTRKIDEITNENQLLKSEINLKEQLLVKTTKQIECYEQQLEQYQVQPPHRTDFCKMELIRLRESDFEKTREIDRLRYKLSKVSLEHRLVRARSELMDSVSSLIDEQQQTVVAEEYHENDKLLNDQRNSEKLIKSKTNQLKFETFEEYIAETLEHINRQHENFLFIIQNKIAHLQKENLTLKEQIDQLRITNVSACVGCTGHNDQQHQQSTVQSTNSTERDFYSNHRQTKRKRQSTINVRKHNNY